MPFALDTKNDTEHFLGDRLKEMIAIRESFGAKRYFTPKLGGMCWRHLLARVKKIIKEGNASLRNGCGMWGEGSAMVCYRLGVPEVDENI